MRLVVPAFAFAALCASPNLFASASVAATPNESQGLMCGAGKDAYRPDLVDYFINFPTEESASRAAAELDARQFRHQVRTAAVGPGWILYVAYFTVPTQDAFAQSDGKIRALAARHGVRYEGYGCSRNLSTPARASAD